MNTARLLTQASFTLSQMMDSLLDEGPGLYWDSTYAIAVALIEQHPERHPEDVGIEELADLVQSLPGFRDDPAFVTERILLDIQIAWYEEATIV